jgi:low affinity Fe/Cu permease
MKHHKTGVAGEWFESLAHHVARWTKSDWAFIAALGVIVAWGLSGSLHSFSDVWLLSINTGASIITFLMVFLMQRSQHKESVAMHLKLNEIVASLAGASNRLINVEDLTEAQVRELRVRYHQLVEAVERGENRLRGSLSVETTDPLIGSSNSQSPQGTK